MIIGEQVKHSKDNIKNKAPAGRRQIEDIYDELASRWAIRAEKLQQIRRRERKFRLHTLS